MIPAKLVLLVLIPGLLLAVACGSDDAPRAPTAAAVPAPTATATPSPTATRVPGATRLPTAIPVPGATRVPGATPSPTAAPAGTAPPEANAPKAIEGGTLVLLGSEPPTLDPHLTGDATSARYIMEIFGGLLTINKDLEIVPDLAEDWSVSASGASFTFRLNRDASFHDGRQVTAGDIKWSLDRAANPATEAPTVDVFLGDIIGVDRVQDGVTTEIAGVSVIDDRTLNIDIDAPKVAFIAKLTYPTSFVIDRNDGVDDPRWILEPNGTGPFRLADYQPGETLLLTRFEDYHLGPANLDEARFILSGGNSLLMFENEEIHATPLFLVGLDIVLDPSNPLRDMVVKGSPRFEVDYVGMNVNEPPFDDLKFRQALNYAVDRETVASRLLQDTVTPAKGIIPPGFPGFNPSLVGYSFDPDKARRLLAESKYGGDLENLPLITLTVPGSFSASIGPTMEAVLAMWEEHLGVRMDLLKTEWAIYLEDLRKGRFQMYGGIGWIADYPDPENFLDILFHSESSNNHSEYSDPALDRLLEEARVEQSETARFALYHQAEATIVAAAPWVPLWHTNGGYVLVQPTVKDYFLFPMVIPQLRYIYFTE